MKSKRSILIVIFIIILAVISSVLAYYIFKNNTKSINSTEDKTIEQNNNEIIVNEADIANTKIVKQYDEMLPGHDYYAVIDLDGDGKVELITYKEEYSTTQISAVYTLYKYVDGNVIELGKIEGRKEDNALYKMNDNTLLTVYGHMGYEISTVYKIQKEKLVQISSKERDVQMDENYTTGDELISFDLTANKNQIEKYK